MSEKKQTSEHRASIEELLKAGTHFGHLTSRWNPKMKSFIFMKRNGIHILNLHQTQKYLDEAAEVASRYARRGKRILFAGTKKQAQAIIRKHAEASGSPYVVERWLGGTLTNFATIRKSIRRMEELVKMEEDGSIAALKKKERLMKSREREKLEKILTGIQDMARIPGAIFVVDIRREHIAIKEAKKLKIPVIAIVDTNCDPDLVDFPIPANDDASNSIDLITGIIAAAILEGKAERDEHEAAAKAEKEQAEAEAETKKKRARTAKKVEAVTGADAGTGAEKAEGKAAEKTAKPEVAVKETATKDSAAKGDAAKEATAEAAEVAVEAVAEVAVEAEPAAEPTAAPEAEPEAAPEAAPEAKK